MENLCKPKFPHLQNVQWGCYLFSPSVLAWRIPGTGSLVGCRLRGCTESDTTEATQQQWWTSLVAQMVKNLPVIQDGTLVPSLGWEEPPGEGNGNPLEYSYLKNSKDRGAWQAIVHGVAKS